MLYPFYVCAVNRQGVPYHINGMVKAGSRPEAFGKATELATKAFPRQYFSVYIIPPDAVVTLKDIVPLED